MIFLSFCFSFPFGLSMSLFLLCRRLGDREGEVQASAGGDGDDSTRHSEHVNQNIPPPPPPPHHLSHALGLITYCSHTPTTPSTSTTLFLTNRERALCKISFCSRLTNQNPLEIKQKSINSSLTFCRANIVMIKPQIIIKKINYEKAVRPSHCYLVDARLANFLFNIKTRLSLSYLSCLNLNQKIKVVDLKIIEKPNLIKHSNFICKMRTKSCFNHVTYSCKM